MSSHKSKIRPGRPDRSPNTPKQRWLLPVRVIAAILILILASAVSIYVYRVTMQPRIVPQPLGIASQKPVGEIVAGTSIRQTVKVDHDVDGFTLLMATYARSNSSQLTIRIVNLTLRQTVLDRAYPAAGFTDNAAYRFQFDNNDTYEGAAEYEIVVTSPDGQPGNAVTIWESADDQYKPGILTVNGVAQAGDLVVTPFTMNPNQHPIGMFLSRLELIALFFAFLLLNVLIDLRKLYDFIFRRRVLLVALVILFFTVNQFHFSSIGMYDKLVQPDQGSEFVDPVWGTPRGIRSDEWLVGTPQKLTAQYVGYGEYNDIMRAERAQSLPATGLRAGFAGLANPTNWGYYLLGPGYGLAFSWISFLMLTLLFSFELFLILSSGNRLVSLLGAVLIAFSGYFLWWSFAVWLLAGQGALVFIYHFMHVRNRLCRAACGFGIAIFGSLFIVSLYPAWQVPAGYLYLGVLVWLLISNRDRLKAFGTADWLLLGGTLALLAAITVAYLWENRSYMEAIMGTVYPGRRVSYGGFALDKLFYWLYVLIYPFRNIVNPSEMGVTLSFYPLPTILAAVLLIRKKGRDLLTLILLAVSLPLTLYCSVGLPPILAKAMLLTFSTPERLVDILGVLQIYLLVVALSRFEGVKKLNPFLAWGTALVTVEIAWYFCSKAMPGYLSIRETAVVANVFIVVCALLLTSNRKPVNTLLFTGIICVSLASGLFVNPIMKGLDVFYSKPAAKAVQRVTQTDRTSKWITVGSLEDSGFLIALGAPTVNSVNYIPNMALWQKLDPAGRYSELYNRYAHISIELVPGQTSASLRGPDYLALALSYDDLQKTGARYIFSRHELTSQSSVDFLLLYRDSGIYIYEVAYR